MSTTRIALSTIVIACALGSACSSTPAAPATTTPAPPATSEATSEPSADEAPAPPPTTSAPTPASEADYATLCPVLADRRPIGGTGPSVRPGAVEVDLQALRDAFVAPPGWTLGELGFIGRGTAGHASPQLSGTVSSAGSRVSLQLLDLVHVCRCHEGDGVALRDRDVAIDTTARTARSFGGSPGVVESQATDGASVRVWVGDRCLVTLAGARARELTAIADSIAWGQLDDLCVRPSR